MHVQLMFWIPIILLPFPAHAGLDGQNILFRLHKQVTFQRTQSLASRSWTITLEKKKTLRYQCFQTG